MTADIPHLKAVMAAIGRRKSKAKAKASRENGKLGGRPTTRNQERKP